MTAINHALTGAIIGLLVGEPLVAVPAAVLSHFVCDALPHFGNQSSQAKNRRLKSPGFRNYLLAEAGLCLFLVVCLALFRPQHWLLASFCAFLATSPDFLWINRYIKIRRGLPWRRSNYAKFAGGIQWFERPIGAAVEVAWFMGGLIILAQFFV